MGQKASKAVASRLSRQPKQQLPKGDPLTGFHRGSVPDPREVGQRQFLEKQGEYKEMPQDLIRFLNDVGPLKRSDDEKSGGRGKSDRRIPRSLVEEENATPQKPMDRQRQSMPLAEKVEGFNTERTTSFSNKRDLEDPKDFAVGDVVDLFRFLSAKRAGHPVGEQVEAYYDQITRNRNVQWTKEEIQSNKDILRNTLQYLDIPVLMKDTDKSYVGASPERIEELKLLKIVEVPKQSAILVLEDLVKNENVSTSNPSHK